MLYYETLLTARFILEDRYAKVAHDWLLADALYMGHVRSGVIVAAGLFLVHVGERLAGVRYEQVQPLSCVSMHR